MSSKPQDDLSIEVKNRIKRAALMAANTLDLSGLELLEIPEEVFGLRNLKTLIISCNQIKVLPEKISQLTQLEALYAFCNKLTSVPQTIGSLKQLRLLQLDDNQLEDLPDTLLQLPSLSIITLDGNPDLNLPSEITADVRGQQLNVFGPTSAKQILSYYFRSKRGRQPINEAKIILVGRGGVGKTCIIKKLIHRSFNEKEPETPGIEIHSWPIKLNDGDTVRLHVWDFGGQEILHATHQFFLTERTVYLLVLSGREGNPTQDAEYWLQLIRSFGKESKVIIALNKSNLHPFDVNRGLLIEKYGSLIVGFVKTDCSENMGFSDLKSIIFHSIDSMEHRKIGFPIDWFSIKERLSTMEENFITWDHYQQICHHFGEYEPEAQRDLAKFLHILGIALNYKEDPRLRDTHVLNPRWVTEGIYTILRAAQHTTSDGVIDRLDLGSILDSSLYPKNQHDFLLRLMEKFELCFELKKESNRYLIPELLGENQPDIKKFLEEPGLDFRYQYEVLPEGLLPRFIVQTHYYSERNSQLRWRTGVVLDLEDCTAVVRADIRERRVDVHITGPEFLRRSALAIIREKFFDQHCTLSGLAVEERVPIPDDSKITVSYRHLRELEADGELEYRPEGLGRKIVITELLNGVEDMESRKEEPVSFLGDCPNVKIGIITALPKEFVTMKACLDDTTEYNVPGDGAGRRYVMGSISTRNGTKHEVVLSLADMGNNVASARATLLFEHFASIDTVIMVGIAGGVPSPSKTEDHVRLGDIVVSDKKGVVQYDMVKLREIRSSPIAPSAKLIEGVRLLQVAELEEKRPWDEHINTLMTKLKIKRPSVSKDKLYSSDDPTREVPHPKDPQRLNRLPRLFLGPIASANELLKDPKKRDAIKDSFGVKAVEMEGSGVADAGWFHQKGYLVVRGICDYCDSYKNDEWQSYAAVVAAGFTRALIESVY